MSVAQTDSAAVDSAAFAVIVPPKDSATTWSISGNILYQGAYHYVRTRTNHGNDFVLGNDTIKDGERYRNYFQVPGFTTEGTAYVRAESPDGKVIEFEGDVTSDRWNKFSPNPVTLSYTDKHNRAILGDLVKSDGELYMGGLPLFGLDYTLSLLENDGNESMLQFNGFFGEAVRPLLPGDRHPYLYHERIDDGEAQAQRLAYGGSIKYAPLKKFDIALGAIYADDEIEDPLLRDGASGNTLTSDPMQESFTLFAEANYRFIPQHLDLNFQAAIGRADTADVIRERAINQVFAQADIENTNFTLLRNLMRNESKIKMLSKAELEQIFGDNTLMTKHQMQDSLLSLIKTAKKVQQETETDRDDDRTMGIDWSNQNIAFGMSGNWEYKETALNAYMKYIGKNYYSAGSPDQLSDVREFGVSLHQGLFDVWDLDLNYALLIENAASGGKKNLFGFGEGTHHGLFPDTESQWYKDHERDIDRTRYTQNAGIGNFFQVSKDVQLHAGYDFEYKKQYRPFQLHAMYTEESKVYADKYFAPRKGKATTKYDTGDKTVEIDKDRWNAYKSLAREEFIASKFQERTYKHSVNAGMQLHKGITTVKIDGKFTWRLDGSKFLNDSLVKDFDFSDETWGALGYYYGGADYVEQSYPIVATTKNPFFQHRFSITPRFRTYERDDMEESEVNINEEAEFPFLDEFLLLSLNGELNYLMTTWNEQGKDFKEKELDIVGDIRFRINHSKHFYSEYIVGAGLHNRPDNLSNEYKEAFGGINLSYTF